MTESAFEKLLRSIQLPFGELLYDKSTFRVTTEYFDNLSMEQRNELATLEKFLILTDNQIKVVGGVLFYGASDIQITVLSEYRNMGFMSQIHKNGILEAECYPNQRVTIATNAIESFEDFRKNITYFPIQN